MSPQKGEHRPPQPTTDRSPRRPPQIELQQVLAKLIAESPYRSNRRPIWESVGITSAALSQYALGHARPRLDVLVALADFFGVSLDYLVLGRASHHGTRDESQAMARYVDWALADVQLKTDRRARLSARVSQVLMNHIDQAVNQASSLPHPAMIDDEELLVLEGLNLETCVVTHHLHHDVIVLDDGNVVPGRFAHAVSRGLLADPPQPYSFLLFEDRRKNANDVFAFQRMLRDELGVSEERLRNCEFRSTNERLLVGCCFYRVDMNRLWSGAPGLALAVEDYVTEEGWLAFSMNRNASTKAEVLMDRVQVETTRATFSQLWREASPFG